MSTEPDIKAIGEDRGWPDYVVEDVTRFRKLLLDYGLTVDPVAIEDAWSNYSASMSAQWLIPDGRDVIAILQRHLDTCNGCPSPGNSYGWPNGITFSSIANACSYFHDREHRWKSQVEGLKARIKQLTEAQAVTPTPPPSNRLDPQFALDWFAVNLCRVYWSGEGSTSPKAWVVKDNVLHEPHACLTAAIENAYLGKICEWSSLREVPRGLPEGLVVKSGGKLCTLRQFVNIRPSHA